MEIQTNAQTDGEIQKNVDEDIDKHKTKDVILV